MATIKKNITIDPALYERFVAIAEKKGMRFSTFIAAKVREFVEEEEAKKDTQYKMVPLSRTM